MAHFPSSTRTARFDAQASLLADLSRRGYDFTRNVSELNLRLFQQLMQDAAAASRRILSCTDPAQLFTTVFEAAQPAAEHLYAYQQQLAGLFNPAYAPQPLPPRRREDDAYYHGSRGSRSAAAGPVRVSSSVHVR